MYHLGLKQLNSNSYLKEISNFLLTTTKTFYNRIIIMLIPREKAWMAGMNKFTIKLNMKNRHIKIKIYKLAKGFMGAQRFRKKEELL